MSDARWYRKNCLLIVGLAVGLAVGLWATAPVLAADIRPNQEFRQKASWKLPTAENVRALAEAWLATRDLDENSRAQWETLWSSTVENGGEAHLLDVLCATFAAADQQAAGLVGLCMQPRRQLALPDVAWLFDEKTAAVERHNLRLLYGSWLVQESLFDEAAVQLGGMKPDDVVDPAALLFYQAVVHHAMLERELGLASIGRLLENESTVPKRFVSLGKLLQADLETLKEDSLDHIARRMDDVRRRLDLGRAGPKVRAVEDGVIASLDKLIEEMEKQQQAAAAAAAAGGGGGARPSNPLPDSMPIQQKGPGEVAKKPIGDKSGWGQLPPKDRQEALQQIGKDFPAHYRDMIEQYFRKLASGDEVGDAKEK